MARSTSPTPTYILFAVPMRFELTDSSVTNWRPRQADPETIKEQIVGIEPTSKDWKSLTLPLCYICMLPTIERKTGLEPTTPTLARSCSNQLSYFRNFGDSDRIQTCDLSIRSATLYSSELQSHFAVSTGLEPATHRSTIYYSAN